MTAVAVIPARLASVRLPRKALREIAGEPMIGRVYAAVCACPELAEVIIATDSDEILDVCHQHGWNARMTSSHHRSGTERVQEVSDLVAADVYLNVQGDEPMARPEHLQTLLQLMENPAVEVGTLKVACEPIDVANPNAVKVVTDKFNRALYFSRATMPFDRDGRHSTSYYKHLGFYAYRKSALNRFVALPPSPLELSEQLEQLRFLENQIPIYVAETPYNTIGVDTEEDLERVLALMR